MGFTQHQRGRFGRRCRRSTLAVALTLVLLSLSTPTTAKLYKWVDEQGNVHYSDSVPPEHARQGREVKSDSGETVDQVDPPPTKDELEERRREEQRRKAEQQREEAQAARDRVLLMSYSSVEQIERMRDQRLETLESRISMTQSRIDNHREDLEKERKRAASAERSGRTALLQRIHERIEQIEAQIERNQTVIAETQDKMSAVRDEFNAEIKRYRELTEEKQ